MFIVKGAASAAVLLQRKLMSIIALLNCTLFLTAGNNSSFNYLKLVVYYNIA
jgi:hypothetical protein